MSKKLNLQEVAAAVGGTYVGAKSRSPDSLKTYLQDAMNDIVISACRNVKLPDCVYRLNLRGKRDDVLMARIDTDGALSCYITVILKPGFKYKGGAEPFIHIDDGASLSNGVDGDGAILATTICATESKLVAIVTKAMKILARDAKKSSK